MYMYGFDPLYFVLLAPAMLLAFWAQMRVKSAYAAASRLPSRSGMSGSDAAQAILDANGIRNVSIEMTGGHLSDHYDPRAKKLRLSADVYNGRSLAALGIAAHEVGHAVQDHKAYAPLVIRNGIVPFASVGGSLSSLFLFGGMMLVAMGINAFGLVLLGIALFSLTVIFQLINLPVEFDASARAKETLFNMGLIAPEERKVVADVLSAAAWTYIAATLGALLSLIYYLYRFGLIGGQREN